MEKVPVRELKSRLSTYLARAAGGESFAVTSRGREVATLAGIAAVPAGLPAVPGVVWARRGSRLPPLASLPASGKPVSDLVVAERDHALSR